MAFPAAPLILVVDDFADSLAMYKEYLTFKGYRVATARDGQQAVRRARREPPALVLMDIRMPKMSGLQALHVLRADARFAATPIVALTAHALTDEVLAAQVAGFDEVISKPCFLEDLLAVVERFLAHGRQGT